MPTKSETYPPNLVPIIGMRDSLDAGAADPRFAVLLRNVYPISAQLGGGVVGRPGFRAAGSQVANKKPQWIGQFTKLDGTERTLGFAGGTLYEFNWVTRVWTAVTPTGPTISADARIYAVEFADQLIVSDGVNKPWAWAGGASATVLSNAPVAFGKPTVYYGKLFFIKNSERNVIVWSEENDPTLGYEAAPYNNSWRLQQTEQEALFAVQGTNDALYYWRRNSIGAIQGAVTPDFRTTGTQEAVSSTVGTEAPGSVATYDQYVYFVDPEGRPYRIRPGGGLDELWLDAAETIKGISVGVGSMAEVSGVAWSSIGLVLFAVTHSDEGFSFPSRLLAFAHPSGQFAGYWTTGTGANSFMRIAVVKDDNERPTLMHAQYTSALHTDLRDWGEPEPNGTIWSDITTNAIDHEVILPYWGYELDWEKHFDLVEVALRPKTAMTPLRLGYFTPNETFTWLDQNVAAAAGTDKRVVYGVSTDGRWIRVNLFHPTLNERFWLVGAQAKAFPTAPYPVAT